MHSIDEMRPEDHEMQQALTEQARKMELGPTGKQPDEKITPSDLGEISLAIGVYKSKIVVSFGVPMQAIGLTAGQARAMADMLRMRAAELDPQRKRHGGK